MERINGQAPGFKDLARQVLAWITCAKRPLTTLELRHALAIEFGETHLDEDNLTQTEDLIAACAGLVTIDQESDVIRLVHYTTQEYFERTQHLWFPDAEVDITLACVTYLSFDAFEDGLCRGQYEFQRRLRMFPLYDYTARYWGEHARQSSLDCSCPEILHFLTSCLRVEAASQPLLLSSRGFFRFIEGISGLHLAVMVGLPDFVRFLLGLGNDPRLRDGYERTPLHWAAEYGHQGVVELLLATDGVDPNDRDVAGFTPLLAAAARGQDGAVLQLLATGIVDVEETEKQGKTALHLAAESGHETTVVLLLSTGRANPNSRDGLGRTPLLLASYWEYKGVVEALLATGSVETNFQDRAGRTPLHTAIFSGKLEAVGLLLSVGGADPNLVGRGWVAPLYQAITCGHFDVVKLLLAHELIDPNWSGFLGYTALGLAVDSGYTEIAQLIRSHPRCNGKLASRYES